MTNTNKANNGTVATENTFTNLLVKYELEYMTNPKGEEFTNTLTTIAKIITHSVLRKCIDTSHNESLIEVKRDIVKDSHSLDTIARANNELYTLSYNRDGELIRKAQKEEYKIYSSGEEKTIKSKDSLRIGYNREIRERLGDGLDLVNVAIITLLEQTREHGANLEQAYEIRRLKQKIYIKLEDSAKGWETVTTTPIQETFKAVRRAIENSRAIATDPRNGYSYLEDIATDSETGEETTVYRRLDKYSDLGSYNTMVTRDVCDIVIENIDGDECSLSYKISDTSLKNPYGKLYSADVETVNDMDELVESLNLSDRQATVLKLRLRGYGYKAIGTYLGIHYANVNRVCKQIQSKVIAQANEPNNLFDMETIKRYMK